jgi:tetratricopeptide (TPR) repeat protein
LKGASQHEALLLNRWFRVRRPFQTLLRLSRRHPRTSLVTGLLLCVIGTAAGVHCWALHRFHAAEQALQTHHLEEAQQHLQFYLSIWPRSLDANLLAARTERLLGNYEQAESYLNRCKELQPIATGASQLEWLLLRAQRGELEDVEEGLWYSVSKNDPDTSLILEALARGYMREMRFLLAATCLNRWLERQPDTARALDWRGWVMERLRQRDAAVRDYQRALELSPGRMQVRLRLAELYLNEAAPKEALPHLEYLYRKHPREVEVLLALARCRILRGDSQEAGRLVDQALAQQPENSTALLYKARLELQADRAAEAEAVLRRALKGNPHDPEAYWLLHGCLTRLGNRQAEAAQALNRHEELKRDLERLAKLLEARPESPQADLDRGAEVGAIFLRIGQETLGLHWLHRVLKSDPHHAAAHQALRAHHEKTKASAASAKR